MFLNFFTPHPLPPSELTGRFLYCCCCCCDAASSSVSDNLPRACCLANAFLHEPKISGSVATSSIFPPAFRAASILHCYSAVSRCNNCTVRSFAACRAIRDSSRRFPAQSLVCLLDRDWLGIALSSPHLKCPSRLVFFLSPLCVQDIYYVIKGVTVCRCAVI